MLNQKESSVALEGLRGLAAIAVVLSHSSKEAMHLVPGLDVEGIGKLGVWMFFLLSAFLLTRQLVGSGGGLHPMVFIPFFVRRFFRIFPLFVCALVIDFYLGRIPFDRLVPAITLQHAPDIFWTVPVEFQYYFVLPLIAFVLMYAGPRKGALLVLIVMILTQAVHLERPVAWQYFSVFVVGSFSAIIADRVNASIVSRLALLGLLPTVIVVPSVMRFLGLDSFIDTDVPRNVHTVFGLIFAPMLLACYRVPSWQRVLGNSLLVSVGKISYPVYLLHPLVITGVGYISIPAPAKGAAVLALTIASSAMAHRLVERPFRNLGYRLTRNLVWKAA